MNDTNILKSLSESIYNALLKDLPKIKYQGFKNFEDRKIKKYAEMYRDPRDYDIEVIHFQQMWGSTALGFSGPGGCAMTKAYTTIVIEKSNQIACIYFNGQLAYKCKDDQKLRDCLNKYNNIPGQTEAKKLLNII